MKPPNIKASGRIKVGTMTVTAPETKGVRKSKNVISQSTTTGSMAEKGTGNAIGKRTGNATEKEAKNTTENGAERETEATTKNGAENARGIATEIARETVITRGATGTEVGTENGKEVRTETTRGNGTGAEGETEIRRRGVPDRESGREAPRETSGCTGRGWVGKCRPEATRTSSSSAGHQWRLTERRGGGPSLSLEGQWRTLRDTRLMATLQSCRDICKMV